MTQLRRTAYRSFVGFLAVLMAASSAQALLEPYPGFELSGSLFNYTEFRYQGKGKPLVYNFKFQPTADPNLIVNLTPFAFGANNVTLFDKYKNINAFRTELTLEATYKNIPHWTPVVKLRPFFDGMYTWENKIFDNSFGAGGVCPTTGSTNYCPSIGQFWESNFLDGNLEDGYDPMFREAYVDVNYHPFFARVGRQLVTWGRSDGVSVLDNVNPNNFRNPLTFEQERFRIPLWMVNLNYDFGNVDWIPGAGKELQVLWNMQYLPSRYPGFSAEQTGQHPWELNVIGFANQIINTSNFLYRGAQGNKNNFFNQGKWTQLGSFWEQSEVFLRWRGRVAGGLGFEPFNDFTYSLHYGYLFWRVPGIIAKFPRINVGGPITFGSPRVKNPNGPGTLGGFDLDSKRYQFVGFSFDKALEWLPWQFKGTAFRGEAAYNFDNYGYTPDVQLRRRDNLTYMLGLDQYLYLAPTWLIPTPWFTSMQFWQDWFTSKATAGGQTLLNSPACLAGNGCGKKRYVDIGQWSLFNGGRQQQRTISTLFMFNDFLSGKTLHVELFGLVEYENMATWFRFLLGYNFRTDLSVRAGMNFLWGPDNSVFGQFGDNKSIFTEVKWTF
jgi:hypothetical protein